MKILSFLGSFNKATVAAIVTFVSMNILPSFGIEVPAEVQAGIVAAIVWLVPNIQA